MYKYLTYKEKLYHEGIGSYVSYGIVCINLEMGKVVSKIGDVSTDAAFVQALAEKFTRMELSPCHFLDAVEDAIV